MRRPVLLGFLCGCHTISAVWVAKTEWKIEDATCCLSQESYWVRAVIEVVVRAGLPLSTPKEAIEPPLHPLKKEILHLRSSAAGRVGCSKGGFKCTCEGEGGVASREKCSACSFGGQESSMFKEPRVRRGAMLASCAHLLAHTSKWAIQQQVERPWLQLTETSCSMGRSTWLITKWGVFQP